MGDVLFRDESARVIRKSQPAYEHEVMARETISAHISHPPEDIGAQFYFTNFTCGEPPLSEEHQSWLQRLYFTSAPTPFTAAVEAVGMVALANVYYAPDIASAAKQRYWKALIATKEALQDPHQSIADSTLMAVLSLGTYEVRKDPTFFLLRTHQIKISSYHLKPLINTAPGLHIRRGRQPC